ncbi:hypothetical protein CHUAL_013319 [Chamberlinius hualienensis]
MASTWFIFAVFVISLEAYSYAKQENIIVYQPDPNECQEFSDKLTSIIEDCKKEHNDLEPNTDNDTLLYFESECAWTKLKDQSELVQKTSAECIQLYPNDNGLLCHFKECYCTLVSIDKACEGLITPESTEEPKSDESVRDQPKTSSNEI